MERFQSQCSSQLHHRSAEASEHLRRLSCSDPAAGRPSVAVSKMKPEQPSYKSFSQNVFKRRECNFSRIKKEWSPLLKIVLQ